MLTIKVKAVYTFLMTNNHSSINNELLAIKDIILKTVDCDKIYLFGSYANNTQRKNSDYDLYVVLKNENENTILAEQNIYRNLSKRDGRHTPTDILTEKKNKFAELCALPTIERKIAREGVLLYDIAESA